MEVTQKTDHSVYKELYKFDIKVPRPLIQTELTEYNLPFGG